LQYSVQKRRLRFVLVEELLSPCHENAILLLGVKAKTSSLLELERITLSEVEGMFTSCTPEQGSKQQTAVDAAIAGRSRWSSKISSCTNSSRNWLHSFPLEVPLPPLDMHTHTNTFTDEQKEKERQH